MYGTVSTKVASATIYGEGTIANPSNSTNFACIRMIYASYIGLKLTFMHTYGPDAPAPIAAATKLECDTQTSMLNTTHVIIFHVMNTT